MAATTATSYTELANNVAGFANAFLPEQLGLVNSGAVRVDTNPGFTVGGSTFVVRQRTYNADTWNTPTAATDSTIDAITAANETGVIFRRYKDLGIEDFAKLSSGDFNAIQDIGRIAAHNAALNMEKNVWAVAEAMFKTGGPLTTGAANDLLVDHSSNAMSAPYITKAKKKMGENTGMFEFLWMHPDVYFGSEIESLTTPEVNESLMAEFMQSGMTYAGRFGGFKVILNERVYNTGGVYDSYLTKRGAFLLAYQKGLTFESYRDYRAAAGTDVIRYTVGASVHIPGISWTGTTPSGLGGVTDAALKVATNWTARTGVSSKEIGIVCIKTIAG